MQISKLLKNKGVLALLVLGLFIVIGISGKQAIAAYSNSSAVINPELTIAAQGAKRAADFLEWSINLSNGSNQGILSQGGVDETLRELWDSTFQLVVIIYIAMAIVLAFGFILKAKWLDRWRRYIPWLAISLVAAAFSFVIAVFIIRLADDTVMPLALEVQNLINVPDYDQLINLKSSPNLNDLESVNNTIFLLKSLSLTSYAIGGIMVVRTIILWMLVIILPLVFPFITFPATQSLGRTWLREFLRWLLYGLLVALFLYASVKIFKNIVDIPGSNSSEYGQATNINLTLPSGSGSTGTGATINSSNTTDIVIDSDSYSKYLAAIIMLWASIVLPWLLLRFAIGFTKDVTSGWYEKNKTNPQLQRLLQNIRPPQRTERESASRQRAASATNLVLPEQRLGTAGKLIAPAPGATEPRGGSIGEMPGAQSRPTETLTQPSEEAAQLSPSISGVNQTLDQSPATTGMPSIEETMRADRARFIAGPLKATGLDAAATAVTELERGRHENAPLSTLTDIEQNPILQANISADIDKLRNSENLGDSATKRQLTELKNNITLNRQPGDYVSRGLVAAMRNDTSTLARQNIRSEIKQKNIESIKKQSEKILRENKVETKTSREELQKLISKITHYEEVPSYKTDERTNAMKDIERITRNVANNNQPAAPKQSSHISSATTAPATPVTVAAPNAGNKVSSVASVATELRNSSEGNKLLDSMNMLSTQEIAGAASKNGIDTLLSGDEDELLKTVNNKKTSDDFEKSKKQWVDYYKKTPVPATSRFTNRSDWLKSQIASQEKILNDITSSDIEKRKQALENLRKITPYLLMGHYSLLEITLYLRAKIAAAHEVLENLGEKQNNIQSNTENNQNQAVPPENKYEKSI